MVVDPDGAPLDDVLQAAANCPVTAITVIGESGDCTRDVGELWAD